MSIIIYHNPRCSKSRQTLELLRQNQIEPTIIEYLKTPPDLHTLTLLLKKLNFNARQLLRVKEPDYKEAQLDNSDLTETAIIQAMVDHPRLIERPIVVNGDKAALGRPPENILNII